MNVFNPLTGEHENVIDITQRIRNRASVTQLARPIGYSASLLDLSEAMKRECRRNTDRVNKAIADIQHIVAYAKSGEMKPCDSEWVMRDIRIGQVAWITPYGLLHTTTDPQTVCWLLADIMEAVGIDGSWAMVRDSE